VRAFLHRRSDPCRNALKQIERKVEFDVEAAWNGGEISKTDRGTGRRVRKFKENAFARGKPLGPDEHWRRIVVANAIARQRAQFAKSVEEELKTLLRAVNS